MVHVELNEIVYNATTLLSCEFNHTMMMPFKLI